MDNNVHIIDNFQSDKKDIYRDFVSEICSNSIFEDAVWVCDKRRRSAAEEIKKYGLYFSRIPEAYKEAAKYYSIIKMINGSTINTVITKLSHMKTLFSYTQTIGTDNLTDWCSTAFVSGFKEYLDHNSSNENTNNTVWCAVNNFLDVMNGWDDKYFTNPYKDNPYLRNRKIDAKYIPDHVAKRFDKLFIEDTVSIHIRAVYWILRLIPSRIMEVCAMDIDCIKPFNDKWVLFIPTWKQNGGYNSPIIRTIHLEYKGMGKYLIDLIKAQQECSYALQQYVDEDCRGRLFTYKRVFYKAKRDYNPNSFGLKPTNVFILKPDSVNASLERICKINGIKDVDGSAYKVTSHQFRHNGITDRLEEGFTIEQISSMTGHHGESMILNSYNHVNLKTENTSKKQRMVNGDLHCCEKALFKGRILNMDGPTEERLLKNLRSHRVRGGICSDITGCDCNMYSCLNCDFFVPEVEQLSYFQEQIRQWTDKVQRFKAFPIIVENAKANIVLNQAIVDRIKKMIGGAIIENNT